MLKSASNVFLEPWNGLRWPPMAANGHQWPPMATINPHQHFVIIVSPNVHDMGVFQATLGQRKGRNWPQISSQSLAMMPPNGLKCPQMAPNGPHQHYVFIISPIVHNFGCFRPLWTRKQGEICFKSASNVLLLGLLMALNGPQWSPPTLCVHN